MAASKNNNDQIVISANDARGALGPKDGTLGDTLLPMLIAVIVFAAVGIAVVVMFR
jgi:hypothetical protein